LGGAGLTNTERRIADLVAEGLSNRQVACRVFLSPHTVAFHLRQCRQSRLAVTAPDTKMEPLGALT